MKKLILLVLLVLLGACETVSPVAQAVHTYPLEVESITKPINIIIEEEIELYAKSEMIETTETAMEEPIDGEPIDEESIDIITEEPEPIMQSSEMDPTKRVVALTFDDGPSIHTEAILDILEQYNARATFFVLGNQVHGRKETVQRAAQLGCDIVGHSWNHKNLTHLSTAQIKSQLTDTHALIESIVGEMPYLYRPPYGAVNEKVTVASKEAGFGILKWTVDPRDWEKRNANTVFYHIMTHVKDGSIIICHDTYESTAMAMEKVVPQLITAGYQFVTVSELFYHLDIEINPGVLYLGVK